MISWIIIPRNQKGFTLVELLVVIAIIGVLASLVLLQLGVARSKSRDAKRVADVSQVRTAIELYFDDSNGSYPDAVSTTNLAKYMASQTLPADPLDGTSYHYTFAPPGGGRHYQYHLWAELEQRNSSALGADSDICSTGGATCINMPGNPGERIDGALETCSSSSTTDCVYDVGQR